MPCWNSKGIWVINLLFNKTLKSVVIFKLNSMSSLQSRNDRGRYFFLLWPLDDFIKSPPRYGTAHSFRWANSSHVMSRIVGHTRLQQWSQINFEVSFESLRFQDFYWQIVLIRQFHSKKLLCTMRKFFQARLTSVTKNLTHNCYCIQ